MDAGFSLAAAAQMPIQRTIERLLARGYGLTYDALVRGFRPYEDLLDEIAALVARSRNGTEGRLRVLDVSCGVGTVAARLARDGHLVVGIDAVEHLVEVAREKTQGIGGRNLAFHHVDVAHGPVPGVGTYDVVVSMHTLYWHPDPTAMLAACRRMLHPGGHALFLTYARPAHVLKTFRDVRATKGIAQATRALRWLVPTAVFEAFRDCEYRYLAREEFEAVLTGAGFDVIEMRTTFLAELSLLAWARVP
jgi:2-polyprenyl-3-methyl-5-hydroxy-6-metoxy-1,4-benzoquinol methylase